MLVPTWVVVCAALWACFALFVLVAMISVVLAQKENNTLALARQLALIYDQLSKIEVHLATEQLVLVETDGERGN